MDQVYRIEIPIEVTNNTDNAALRQLEQSINGIFRAVRQGASSGDAFRALEQGARTARQALDQTGDAAEDARDSLNDIDSGNGLQQAGSAAEDAADSVDELGDAAGDAADAMGDLGQAAGQAGHQAGPAFDEAGQGADRFTQRVQRSAQQLRNSFREKLQMTIAALDKASPALKTIGNTVKGLAGKVWNVAVKVKDMVTAPFRKIKDLITNPITMTLSLTGIGMGASDFLGTSMDFTSGMSTVKSLTGLGDSDEDLKKFDQLTAKAKELGETTQFTAAQASEGMQYLAMAGWNTDQITGAMDGMLQLAAAGGTDLGTAADIVSDVMTAMGMEADQATRAANVFAKTATSTNTTVEGLGNTMKYAAPVAHSFGMSLEDVSAAAGLMANSGIKGEMAGTALRSTLLRMSSPTSEMQKTMTKLGISFTDSSGKMKSMSDIIKNLEKGFSGLSESEKLSAAQDLFGTEGASAWLGIINQGSKAYDELAASIYDSDHAAEIMAGTRMDNLAGDITLLQSATDGLKIALMDKLNPFLRQGVQWLTGKIPAITEGLSGMLDGIITKAQELGQRFSEVFNSNEFQNADGFGEKLSIAWDKIIAEPFTEWWNGGGQQKILDGLSDLGGKAGEALKGLFSGIFSALSGEEVAGMDMGGIASAAANMAKTFLSSFTENFDLGEILDKVPGWLKVAAGAIGGMNLFGGVAEGVGEVTDTVSSVSDAVSSIAGLFGNLGDAAGGAGDEVAHAGGILAALKGIIGAIPGWGWAAAAAIAAIGVGIHMYNKHVEEQRQYLLNLGDTVEESRQQWQQTAREVNETTNELDSLNSQRHEIEYQLRVAGYELTDTQITNMQTRVDEIDGSIATITFNIEQSGELTAEEATQTAQQLAQIHGQKVELLASIVSYGGTEQDKQVFSLLEQYDLAQFDPVKQASVYSNIIAMCDDPGKAERVRQLLEQYNDPTLPPIKRAEVAAQIDAEITGNSDPLNTLQLLEQYAAAPVGSDDRKNIAAQLRATLTNATPEQAEQMLPLFEKYGVLTDNEANITASLDTGGVTPEGIEAVQKLADLMAEKDRLTLTIEAGNLTDENYAAKQEQLNGIYEQLAAITGMSADALATQSEGVDAIIAKKQEELRLEQEIAHQRALADAGEVHENIEKINKGQQESQAEVDKYQGYIDASQGMVEAIPQLQLQALEIQNQANALRDSGNHEEYMAYMNGTGQYAGKGYLDLMEPVMKQYYGSITNQWGQKLYGTEAQVNQAWSDAVERSKVKGDKIGGGNIFTPWNPPVYEYSYDMNKAFGGDFDQAMSNKLAEGQKNIETNEGYRNEYQTEVDSYVNDKMQAYKTSVADLTYQSFKGTQYEGMGMDEIASHYAEFANNPMLVTAFDKTLSALDALNQNQLSQGYIDEGMELTVDQVNDIRNKSFENYTPPTAAEEGGEAAPAQPAVNVGQAYSTLATQNTTAMYQGSNDTKFTRDLKANEEEYNAALASGGDTNAVLEERNAIIGEQVTAIRTGIEGIEQLNTDIEAKKAQIAEAQQSAAANAAKYEEAKAAITEAQQSYAQNGNASEALEAVNAQLDSLGLEKIENINQLGEAMERINSAQSTDETALTTLNEELANLQEERINLMVQASNALDSLTWNANRLNTDTSINDALKLDESNVTTIESMQTALGNAGAAATGASGNFGTADAAAQSLRTAVSNAAAELNAIEGTYEIKVNYVFNQTQSLSVPSGAVKKNAEGGIYNGAMISMVAEDGPEAIIPLGNKRRDRGLELWMEAGKMLGVSEFAEGGIAAPYAGIINNLPDDSWGEGTGESQTPAQPANGTSSITVTVDASPTYQINTSGGSTDDIMAVLQAKQGELAELFGAAIAEQLEDIVSNMA